jgi:chitosanase
LGGFNKIVLISILLGTLSLAWASSSFSPREEETIQEITSIFENSTPEFQYDYIEDINDGAGITCGRAGFTGLEIQILAERYLEKRPLSALAFYLPCLKKMGKEISKEYSCLYPSVTHEEMASPEFKTVGIGKVDFGRAWIRAAEDHVMQAIQDEYQDEVYFQPAMEIAARLGLKTPMGAAFIYDACVQMGCNSDLFGVVRRKFAAEHQGRQNPVSLEEEAQWLALYIPERKVELSVTPSGAITVDRVDSLAQILGARNFELLLPLEFDYAGKHFSIEARDFLFANGGESNRVDQEVAH